MRNGKSNKGGLYCQGHDIATVLKICQIRSAIQDLLSCESSSPSVLHGRSVHATWQGDRLFTEPFVDAARPSVHGIVNSWSACLRRPGDGLSSTYDLLKLRATEQRFGTSNIAVQEDTTWT